MIDVSAFQIKAGDDGLRCKGEIERERGEFMRSEKLPVLSL